MPIGKYAVRAEVPQVLDEDDVREPPGREDWSAFLALCPREGVERLLADEGIGPA